MTGHLGAGEARPGFRCGYVALVGVPNVGKSTLMNQFLQQRLAIVTPKPQTTRRRTLGILNGRDFQAILLDTPGLMEPRYELHRAMLDEAREALSDADVVVYLCDGRSPGEIPPMVTEVSSAPRIAAVNKVDLVRDKNQLLPILSSLSESELFEEIIPICALDGSGVAELLEMMVARLPEAPPFYDTDQIAEQSERFFTAEIIREKVFEQFKEEVPYSTEVVIAEFKERDGAKDFIEAWIFAESESQKRILVGKGGQAIRQLGEVARAAVEEFLGREVFLSLRVRHQPKWRKDPKALRRFGYRA